jgi:hypothetical protein
LHGNASGRRPPERGTKRSSAGNGAEAVEEYAMYGAMTSSNSVLRTRKIGHGAERLVPLSGMPQHKLSIEGRTLTRFAAGDFVGALRLINAASRAVQYVA